MSIWTDADEAAAIASIEKWIEEELKEKYPEEYTEIPQEWIEEMF